jgi:small subunit ribosomal protein S20
MAHCKQALKRIRQSEKRRIQGKSVRSEIKTLVKRISDLVTQKDGTQARALLGSALSKLDKAAKAHVYHRNAADHRKSSLSRLVNTVAGAAPAQSPNA